MHYNINLYHFDINLGFCFAWVSHFTVLHELDYWFTSKSAFFIEEKSIFNRKLLADCIHIYRVFSPVYVRKQIFYNLWVHKTFEIEPV